MDEQINNFQPSVGQPAPEPQSYQPAPLTVGLPKASNLLSQAWQFYKQHYKKFVAIAILLVAVQLLTWLVSIFLEQSASIMLGGLGLLLYLASAVIAMISAIAMVYLAKEPTLSVGQALSRSSKRIFPYAWVMFLVSLVTFGGFLLLIVPGIIFGMWLSLSQFVFVDEDLRGMQALARSKQLTKGYLGSIFAKGLYFSLIAGVLILLAGLVASGLSHFFSPLIAGGLSLGAGLVSSAISGLLIAPLMLIFMPLQIIFFFLIYQNLKAIKASQPQEPAKKTSLIVMAILGVILAPALITLVIILPLTVFKGQVKPPESARISFSMNMLRLQAAEYNGTQGSYADFNCQSNAQIKAICDDITTTAGQEPVIKTSFDDFCAYVQLPDERYYCVDNQSAASLDRDQNPGNSGYCDGFTFDCPNSVE